MSLKSSYHDLSQRYRSHQSAQHLQTADEITAYVHARMPATYAAIGACLEKLPVEFYPESLLDIGAGPGTATVAALDRWPNLKGATLIENHPGMIAAGQRIFDERGSAGIHYENQNLATVSFKSPANISILGYVLGELKDAERLSVVKKVWDSTLGYCLIVTPGTPHDFDYLMKVRRYLIELGGHAAAPCPHSNQCPLAGTTDWCHFSVRLQRDKLHRQTKQGHLGYEDEKFSYLIFSKQKTASCTTRVIKKPIQNPGHTILDLCAVDGLRRVTVSKKDKILYKGMRKTEWGDGFSI
ncbi:MAG: rRNA methyltransferase [Alphaproteobacteria bacterium]|nr:rRNA methyltransferase [Alphaproteobacteria bacterium]